MDMSPYTRLSEVDNLKRENRRLKACLYAIRKNKDIFADVFIALTAHPPNPTRAQESYEEMGFDFKCDGYLSTTSGGVFEVWERHAIKTGELGPSYQVFLAKTR